MAQVAIFLKDGVVDGFTPEKFAQAQSKIKGWTLVESDPAFSIDQKYLWTIRSDDNKLVHVATDKTPDEETKDSIAELTKMGLAGQLTDVQVQAAVTQLTKSNLQLTQDNIQLKSDRDSLKQDNAQFKSAFTTLTQEYADLKLQFTNTSTETTK